MENNQITDLKDVLVSNGKIYVTGQHFSIQVYDQNTLAYFQQLAAFNGQTYGFVIIRHIYEFTARYHWPH